MVILSIIGILLAATAAIMTVFYGGNVMGGASSKASANELMNLASNVTAAAISFKRETGANPTAITDLTLNNVYIKGPVPTAAYLGGSSYGFTTRDGYPMFFVDNLDTTRCSLVNKTFKQTVTAAALGTYTFNSSTPRMGCVENWASGNRGYFYSML